MKELLGTGVALVTPFDENLKIDFPEHKEWIDNVLNRIIDLAVPFKNFHYYNPKQEGRWSLKVVLPALTKLTYKGMGIDNGGDASAMYFYSHIKKTMDGKEKIRKDLLKYCELDTYAMVEILDKVEKLIN